MRKYVNGYKSPKFVRKNAQNQVIATYEPSGKYQFLREFHETIAVFKKIIDGSKKIVGKYIDYEWRLFYTDYAEKDDLMIYGEIEMALFRPTETLWMFPHKEITTRSFKVLPLPEKITIDLHLHNDGKDDTPNKGYEISLVNVDSIRAIQMIDPDAYYNDLAGSINLPHKASL